MNFNELFGLFGQQGGYGQPFSKTYRCRSLAFHPSLTVQKSNFGGKIILPPSALDQLARLNIQYPMLFELKNPNSSVSRKTHCGVLEFTAEEGFAYLPYWMMQLLVIDEDSFISVRNVNLPKGTYVKVQPHTVGFINSISNPKAVLENSLRNFCALTQGDIIAIHYNNKDYYLGIIEVKPYHGFGAVSIVETDISLEFAPPMDSEEFLNPGIDETSQSSTPQKPEEQEVLERKPADIKTSPPMDDVSDGGEYVSSDDEEPDFYSAPKPQRQDKFVPFSGTGRTLRG